MKLSNLAQQDPAFIATGKAGLGHGNRLNVEVWTAYSDDPVALAREVRRIHGVSAAAADGSLSAVPSRGPAPVFGQFGADRVDGTTSLYLFQLKGAVQSMFPIVGLQPGLTVVKIGRSNDLIRRGTELNFGFPPGASVAWSPLFSFGFDRAARAHVAEQRLLSDASNNGWTIGREFVIAPIVPLLACARASSYQSMTSKQRSEYGKSAD